MTNADGFELQELNVGETSRGLLCLIRTDDLWGATSKLEHVLLTGVGREVQTSEHFEVYWAWCEEQLASLSPFLDGAPGDSLQLLLRRASFASATYFWMTGKSFPHCSAAAGGPEYDGILARVLRRTQLLLRQLEMACRVLGEELKAEAFADAGRRMKRGGSRYRIDIKLEVPLSLYNILLCDVIYGISSGGNHVRQARRTSPCRSSSPSICPWPSSPTRWTAACCATRRGPALMR